MPDTLKRILCVEDNLFIAEVLTMTLETVGNFEVAHVASGKEALAEVELFKPQLILLDVMMPEMDGMEVLRRLKANPSTQAISVIFLTGNVQKKEIEKYKELGAIGVLAKPFDPVVLCDSVVALWNAA